MNTPARPYSLRSRADVTRFLLGLKPGTRLRALCVRQVRGERVPSPYALVTVYPEQMTRADPVFTARTPDGGIVILTPAQLVQWVYDFRSQVNSRALDVLPPLD